MKKILVFFLFGQFLSANAQTGRSDQLKIETIGEVKRVLGTQLGRYCGNACELIRVDVKIREEVSETTELGFEGVAGAAFQPQLFVDKLDVEIQVDERVTQANRERLQKILENYLRSYALTTSLSWRTVRLPNIGSRTSTADFLKEKLETRLAGTVNKVFATYCPNNCLLAYVNIAGELIPLGEATGLPRNRLVREDNGRSVMRIDGVTIDVTLDEALDPDLRRNIISILQAKTRYAAPLEVNVSITKFPQTYADKLKSSEDPYGLEKLRRILTMFRDLASTKEIITNSTTTSDSSSSDSLESKSSESEKNRSSVQGNTTSYEENSYFDWMLWGSLGLIALLLGFLIFKYVKVNNDANLMVANAGGAEEEKAKEAKQGQVTGYDAQGNPIVVDAGVNSGVAGSHEELALKLKVEKLRSELLQQLIDVPKVAKETFGRMLKEDGVEHTAKYLQIFGHVIILELIEDPGLSRDIYALSEFFHKSNFKFTLHEEWDLLRALQTKITAGEIKVLSAKGSDKFEFLNKLDAAQVYTLISEEKAQVQSIVLTQLDKKRRMAIFDMYQGDAKVDLMSELCRADAIPKEFLFNVAKALARKVHERPEFDTENIRSSEIILDLLERAHLREQRQIMANLQRTNPEAARGIMMKLITIEILPYLKDGHLLELILGLEREDLVNFLAGTEDHIRNLLLSKAPYELVESWQEDLQNVGAIDDKNYRLVELKIFSRIRSLADSGSISILDINEMIFAPEMTESTGQGQVMGQLSNASMVA